MGKQPRCAKCKVFAADAAFLQEVVDSIRNEFGKNVIISNLQPAKEGDWFAYVTFTEEAQR